MSYTLGGIRSKHVTPEFEAWQENGGLLFIRGPKCVGKTAALDRICEAEAGVLALWATGWLAEYSAPFGVLYQIMGQLDAVDEAEEHPGRADRSSPPGERHTHRFTLTHEHLFDRILNAAAKRPVLIVVDDINYVDLPSQAFLSFLARRLKGTSIRLVLTERTGHAVSHCDELRTDVLRLPYTRVVRLRAVESRQIARYLTESVPEFRAPSARPAAERLAAEIHDLTGGNVLLTDVLVRKWLSSSDPSRRKLLVDTAFHDCVRVMAIDTDVSGVARGARAAAVLGDLASPQRLSRLLEVDVTTASRIIGGLNDLGMLDGNGLRHEMRLAFLQEEGFAERADFHLRAAYVLFEENLPLPQVAEHLTAAGRIGTPWDLPLTLGLVDRALQDGSTDVACALLRLAKASASHPDERCAVEMVLLRTVWLTDPSLPASLVPTLIGAARRGALDATDLAFLARVSLWYGFTEFAAELVPMMRKASTQRPYPPEVTLTDTLYSVWNGIPSSGDRLLRSGLRSGLCPSETGLVRPGDDHCALVGALHRIHGLLDEEARTQAIFWAEQVLQGIRVRSSLVEAFLIACDALEGVDSLATARPWCNQLSAALEAHPSPLWKSLVSLVQAKISFGLGDLGSAHRLFQEALTHKPWHLWGVRIAALAAFLVEVLTEMGRFDEAASVLDRPIPAMAYQGEGGLRYVNARGRYHLATERLHAALADFEFCRDLSASLENEGRVWAEAHEVVSWRHGMAEAYLSLGDVEGAREVLRDQLQRLPEEETTPRGTALRLLAKTVTDTPQRLSLLKRSVDTLEHSGNRLQLAYTLAELAAAHQETSQLDLARATSKRAHRMAQQCGAGRLVDLLTTDTADGGGRDRHALQEHAQLAELSSAERRVAVLAILGHTNREISTKLFITASTVEQHLTRIYRKLRVRSREDLLDRFPSAFMGLDRSA